MTRFPKQAWIMLKNSLDTNTTHKNRNWAGCIKDWLEAYGFHAVWTNGRVKNEKAFLSAFKQRMIERFKQEWFDKISESERFSTYFSFKTVHQLETYLNDITIKKFRDSLIRLLLGINELGVNKRFLCDSFVIKTILSVQVFWKINLISYSAVQPMMKPGENICHILLSVKLYVLLTLFLITPVLNNWENLQCLLFML